MIIKIVCVGKLKEDFYKKAQAEYSKMLGRFCEVLIEELQDEPLCNVKGDKAEAAVRDTEGQRILSKCSGYVIACDAQGKKFTSEAFSQKISDVMIRGDSTICFVVGGSVGLSQAVLKRADLRLSFSDMILPHRLFRIVLLEQVFRAFKILNNETYHK